MSLLVSTAPVAQCLASKSDLKVASSSLAGGYPPIFFAFLRVNESAMLCKGYMNQNFNNNRPRSAMVARKTSTCKVILRLRVRASPGATPVFLIFYHAYGECVLYMLFDQRQNNIRPRSAMVARKTSTFPSDLKVASSSLAGGFLFSFFPF
ncbi:hypothetical protein BDV32DRAFT_148934 [Aspergillus pseudonomiae]|nr:hypothetical protein BDV32DRAFT_148934 [Aspergillus pseudonomiae]